MGKALLKEDSECSRSATEHPRMQLNFVAVGPQRTGTTWLYECLRAHPQLCFAQGVKETFFLDEQFHKGWEWYGSHFRHRLNGQLCAEVGSTYFDIPETTKRLWEHNPDCRIIINLRDPAARSFSLYLHHKKRGRLHCDFPDAIKKMPRIIQSSHYQTHLRRWIETFGQEQIHIVLQEDIAAAPEQVLERLYRFAGIAQVPPPAVAWERVNPASLPSLPVLARFATRAGELLRGRHLYGPIELAKRLGLKRVYSGTQEGLPMLEPDIRKALIKEFEPDITYVEVLLRRPLPEWRRSSPAC